MSMQKQHLIMFMLSYKVTMIESECSVLYTSVCHVYLQSVRPAIPARVVMGTCGMSPFILTAGQRRSTHTRRFSNIFIR